MPYVIQTCKYQVNQGRLCFVLLAILGNQCQHFSVSEYTHVCLTVILIPHLYTNTYPWRRQIQTVAEFS